MSKIMTVDVLSSIKNAKPSKSVNELFDSIKNASTKNTNKNNSLNTIVSINDLREDVIISSSEIEKQIIIDNFPKQKNRFLVVSKIIEE